MTTKAKCVAHYLAVGFCLCFVYAVGVTNLKTDPIKSYSEWNSIRHLNIDPHRPQKPLSGILESISEFSPDHGPLYFVLLSFWRTLTGADLFTYRLLSVFFGLLGLAMAYRLAHTARDRETALYALIFTAFLSFFVYFTYEVRMYSLLPLLAAAVAWQYWRVVSARGDVPWRHWIALAIVSAAIVYVHYFGFIVLVAIGVYHVLGVKKNRRWFGVCFAMIVAGILFAPWLPVAAKSLETRDVPDSDRLLLAQAILALVEIHSNGLFLTVPLLLASAFRPFKGLRRSEIYLLTVAILIFILMIVANEIAPLLIARRIRYAVVLTIPLTCAMAIGLRRLPGGRRIHMAVAALWIASFFIFNSSDALSLYTNRKTRYHVDVPHYEDFIYEINESPRFSEIILSLHPTVPLDSKVYNFYRFNLPQWKDIVHVSYDEEDELFVYSWHERHRNLDNIASDFIALWVIHNPQRTDLQEMAVYKDWLLKHYRPCKRYIETADNVIEHYFTVDLPCALIHDEQPMAITYENGTEIANVVYEQNQNELSVYFWWRRVIHAGYSLTIQVFDQQATKVQQIDAVIDSGTFIKHTLDLAPLPAGEYVAKLIIYDFETGKSQPGFIVNREQRFDREVEIASFTLSG